MLELTAAAGHRGKCRVSGVTTLHHVAMAKGLGGPAIVQAGTGEIPAGCQGVGVIEY